MKTYRRQPNDCDWTNCASDHGVSRFCFSEAGEILMDKSELI